MSADDGLKYDHEIKAALHYEVLAVDNGWMVEAIHHESEGEMYWAVFYGIAAEQRARQYADWMNAADSRAPAEVLQALKRDVLAIVRKSMTDTGFEYWSKEISARFDAAVKEPTK